MGTIFEEQDPREELESVEGPMDLEYVSLQLQKLSQLPAQMSEVLATLQALKHTLDTRSSHGQHLQASNGFPEGRSPDADVGKGAAAQTLTLALAQCATLQSRQDADMAAQNLGPQTRNDRFSTASTLIRGSTVSAAMVFTGSHQGLGRRRSRLGQVADDIGAAVDHALHQTPLIGGSQTRIASRKNSLVSIPQTPTGGEQKPKLSFGSSSYQQDSAINSVQDAPKKTAARVVGLSVTVPEIPAPEEKHISSNQDIKQVSKKTGFASVLPNVMDSEDQEKESVISKGTDGSEDGKKHSKSSGQVHIEDDKASSFCSSEGEEDKDNPANSNLRAWSLAGYGLEEGKNRRVSLGSLLDRRKSKAGPALVEDVNSFWRDLVFVIPEDAPIHFTFDIFLAISVLLTAFWVPLQLAYDGQRNLPEAWRFSFVAVDTIMILDVVFGFFTGTYSGDGHVEPRIQVSAKQYFESWFLPDLLASIPISSAQEPGSAVYVVVRIMKFIKVFKLSKLLSRFQLRTTNMFATYLKVLLPLLIVAHLMACCWQLVRQQDSLDAGLGSLVEVNPFEFYVQDVYWVVMTMTSVGYGDITPNSSVGRVYATLIMLASSIYGGFVVSSTSQAIKLLFDDDLERKVRDAGSFMHSRQVTRDLQSRVENCIRQQVRQERSLSNAPKLLAKLTPPVQRELSAQLLRSIMSQFPLFREAQKSYLAQLAQIVNWVLASAGDLVVEEGQVVQEMVFVVQGQVLCLRQSSNEDSSMNDYFDHDLSGDEEEKGTITIQDEWLHSGAWFGERCLFMEQETRDFTALADSDVELAVLAAAEYSRITQLYPKLWLRHRALVKQCKLGKMSLQDLKYAPSEEEEARSWGLRTCLCCCRKSSDSGTPADSS
eukprot:TRINITY_DN21628_c1_g1_i1.p1 TRINITY_DN21628_c1_g1~~TRINITY_DN21628_c1_g1_i1.p1  ORF type:complete len:881 (+),score=139.03 TRINITY_DN21628_c1_g1_i1:61-2703(+)